MIKKDLSKQDKKDWKEFLDNPSRVPNKDVSKKQGTDRIKRLQTNTIDLDYLDEQIRKQTGYINENEVLVIFEQ